MRLGRRIAIDYGAARIGVAVSSIDALISSPLATIPAGINALEAIATLIREQDAIEVYVGLPLNLSGNPTKSTVDAIEFSKSLAGLLSVPVRLVDERMSTRAAQGQLYASGRNSKQSRSLIDAAAASLILESAIAIELSTNKLPGKAVGDFED